jgi:hypothetical protein
MLPTSDIVRVLIGNRIRIREKAPASSDMPLSAECRLILAYAAEEAERLLHRHIGIEHLILGILREPKCRAAEVLVQRGLKLNAVREELAHAPMRQEHSEPDELRSVLRGNLFYAMQRPALPPSGVVPDADTAKHIAEAVWRALYGAESVASQTPLQAEQKNNVWVVSGSAASEPPLFAFILRADGRILSVGRGSTNTTEA